MSSVNLLVLTNRSLEYRSVGILFILSESILMVMEE